MVIGDMTDLLTPKGLVYHKSSPCLRAGLKRGGGGLNNLLKWVTILLFRTTRRWFQFSIKNYRTQSNGCRQNVDPPIWTPLWSVMVKCARQSDGTWTLPSGPPFGTSW